MNIFKFSLEWLFLTITATTCITEESRLTSLFMSLEKPLCIYKQARVAVNVVCDSSSIWTSIMIPWAREFLQCYICACHLWWVMLYDESQAVCLPDPSGFIWCLVFGGWGRGLLDYLIIYLVFFKYPLLYNCRWFLLPFYECFCWMWTCCTSSGLELKIRKVSMTCNQLIIVVYDVTLIKGSLKNDNAWLWPGQFISKFYNWK